jgi:hypothetical protein
MMAAIFNRKIKMSFSSPEPGVELPPTIENLNIGFTVDRTLQKEPSTLEATVFNLSAETRQLMQQDARLIVTLEAGYGDNVHAIFVGDVRRVRTRREVPDLATDIEAGDGERGAKQWARKWFPEGASVDSVFRYLAKQAGYGEGNVSRAVQIRDDKGLPDRLESGIHVRGYALDELAELANSRGIEFSIQDGEVQMLEYGQAKEGVPVTVINPTTGLIGYPSVDSVKVAGSTNKTEDIMTLNHRLLPNVFPGSLVDVKSEFVTGRYRVLRALYSGSLFGEDFNIEIEGKLAA